MTPPSAPPRVLVVAPGFLSWDLGTYVESLLAERGVEHGRFAYLGRGDRATVQRELLEEAARFRPDVVLGLKMGLVEPETLRTLRRRGAFVMLWYVDCESPEIPVQMARLVPEVDAFLTTAKGMIPRYRALASTPVHWIYEGVYLPAFPDVEPEPALRPLYASEVAFVGNLLHPPVEDESLALRRFRLLARVAERFELKLWGTQGEPAAARERWGGRGPLIPWPAYHEELVRICRASGIVLGINTVNSVELYFSNRTFLTLASGGFHLTHYVPGLETMFENHTHLVWFESDDECLELARYYLDRPELRRRIAEAGRSWTRRRYDMGRQVDRILEIAGERRAP